MKDDLNGETMSLDTSSSSLPTEIPAADAPVQLDPSDQDPLDSCETIPVPPGPESIKPVDTGSDAPDPEPSTKMDASALPSSALECAAPLQEGVSSPPPLASVEDAPLAAPEPVASAPEPAGPDPVEETKESHAPKRESRAIEAAVESKADVARDRAPETELRDEKPPADALEAATPSSNGARDDTHDATSTSAHVLSVAAHASDEPEGAAIASEPAAPAPRESVQPRMITGSRWLVPVAVAVVVGLWWLPRRTSEEATPQDMPARVASPTVGGDPAWGVKPPPPSAVSEASNPSSAARIPESRGSLPESSGSIVEAPTAPPARPLAEKTDQAPDDRAPARLSAYKAAASAGRKVSKCRYAGDSPGVVRVVVTFDPSGHVRRTQVQGNLVNPMTLRCITSQFNELTIAAFSGEPTTVVADVMIY